MNLRKSFLNRRRYRELQIRQEREEFEKMMEELRLERQREIERARRKNG